MINLNINGCAIAVDKMKFSDGAIGAKLVRSALPVRCESATITVLSEGKINDELFEVASVVDILRDINSRINITLRLPFAPYARQDRRMVNHDAFSLRVYAGFLNSLKLDKVITLDAHSDVAPAVFNNCLNITQDQILKLSSLRDDIKGWGSVLVCPDAGAAKKTHKAAEALGFDPNATVFMEKVRDVTNGRIIASRIMGNTDNLRGTHAVIIDDLCDGGGTFIQAAQSLYDAGCAGVGLFVTHGIFSRGYKPIFDAGIDRIWTTDSFIGPINTHRFKITCVGVHEIFDMLGIR